MNHTVKRTLQISAMILVGATIFMTGCGPANIDDPNELADMGYSDSANDAADKSDAAMKPMMEEPAKDEAQPEAAAEPPKDGAGPAMAEGNPAPNVEVPPVAVVAPTRVVQLPPAFVKLPSEFRAEAPIVTQSGEQINYQRNILRQRDIHVAQPAIEEHLITKNLHTHVQDHTTIYNHPSFRRNVSFAQTASDSAEVLPTTVVTTPTVVAPGFVGGPIIPARPFCAPWYSGGMLRSCGGYGFGGGYPYLR